MFIETFSTFYKTFVGIIALFDWLPGQDKKLILEKKDCFLRTIVG